jgi:hypothetical protein
MIVSERCCIYDSGLFLFAKLITKLIYNLTMKYGNVTRCGFLVDFSELALPLPKETIANNNTWISN